MNVILDYDVGNLDSVLNGFKKVGLNAIVTKDKDIIRNATSLILPGVGAFKDAMKSLEKSGLIPLIKRHIEDGKYLFGICLGMQLLYEKSYEFGVYPGLGVIPGVIKKIPSDVKVPHMGWNNLLFNKDNKILKYIKENDYVYFVHSFYVDSSMDEVLAYTNYSVKIPAIVQYGNVYATQFHPEKSGEVGLNIIKAYGEMINETISRN